MKKLLTVILLSGFIASAAVANHCHPEHTEKAEVKASCSADKASCSAEKKACASCEAKEKKCKSCDAKADKAKKACCAKGDKKDCKDDCTKPCCAKSDKTD